MHYARATLGLSETIIGIAYGKPLEVSHVFCLDSAPLQGGYR